MELSIAKFCATNKQHFAPARRKTCRMVKKSVAEVVSEALRFHMGRATPPITEKALGARAGVSPRTVANFLRPATRAPSASGKQPSGKLTELEMIATALGISIADLVTDMSEETRLQRVKADQILAILDANGPGLGESITHQAASTTDRKFAA
jgi:transcriptional regulator with XRE-family HTH domain